MDPTLAELYKEQVDLKRRVLEALRHAAAMPVEDYELASGDGPVRLSSLFGDRPDLLVIHNMGRSCAWCTLWADGIVGLYPHLDSRAAVVMATPDAPAVQAEFARSRGWPWTMVSHAGTTFSKDLGYEVPEGQMPGVSALRRETDGSIRRTGMDFFGPGDEHCGLWRMFDLLAEGPNGWQPRFGYG